jgi:hypothetical protein
MTGIPSHVNPQPPDRNLIGFGKDHGVRDLCAKLARRVLPSDVRSEASEMICNAEAHD